MKLADDVQVHLGEFVAEVAAALCRFHLVNGRLHEAAGQRVHVHVRGVRGEQVQQVVVGRFGDVNLGEEVTKTLESVASVSDDIVAGRAEENYKTAA